MHGCKRRSFGDVPDPISVALGIEELSTAAVYGGWNLEGRSNETALNFKTGRNNICLHQAAEETVVQFSWGMGPHK